MCQVCNTRQSQWRITSVKLYWLYYRVCLLRYVVPVIRILIVCYWYVSDENVQQTTLLAVNVHFILHPQACICKQTKEGDESLHSRQSFWDDCQINSMHSSTRKTPQKRTLRLSLRHLLVNLKNVRVFALPMPFNIELRRQCHTLIFPPIRSSNGVS